MSFCRITGKARGLPKPNYFPLLPPISPADAKRFCRITGKAFGLPGHHYTPVLLVRASRRKACAVTGGSAGGSNARHRFPAAPGKEAEAEAGAGEEAAAAAAADEPQRHVVVADFRYVFPALEEVQDGALGQVLAAHAAEAPAPAQEEKRFVYTVAERRCSLVIPARLEAAVRDGEVQGVLLADDADEVRFQLRKGADVTVGVRELDAPQQHELWEGEGPSEQAQAQEPSKPKAQGRKKRKKTDGLSCMTKIFEEKERVQEAEQQKSEAIKAKRPKVVEVKLSAPEEPAPPPPPPPPPEGPPAPQLVQWNEFDPHHHRVDANLVMCSGDWRDLVKPLIESWDWDEFEREAAAAAGEAVVTELPRPVPLRAEAGLLEAAAAQAAAATPPQLPVEAAAAGALPVASAVAPLAPLAAQPAPEVTAAVAALPPKSLARTSGLAAAVEKNPAARDMLPAVGDIPQVMEALERGVAHKLSPKAHGLVLDIGAAKKFVAGQTVDTPSGRVFVPGQTLDTPAGPAFVPGVTVLGADGPVLVPGRRVDTPGAPPAFVAGVSVPAADGAPTFVPGQSVATADGNVFMPGQTLLTPQGPVFIPGQTVAAENAGGAPRFVPGHTLPTPDGPPKFVPGQAVAGADGASVFVPGHSVRDERGGWEFVPGQTQRGADGQLKFVAGQTLPTPEGPRFVPGRAVPTADGGTQFVPGVTVEEEDGRAKFVPGRTVHTADGPQFIEGQLLKTDKGLVFAPGKVVEEAGTARFCVAKSLEEAVVAEAAAAAAAAAVQAAEEEPAAEAVFGHMVQTGKGVAFFPGARAAGLPAGKLVPGRLLRSATSGDVKFVPGVEVAEEGARRFVPGQVVETERGEQFVPGQVVDTAEGPKFVPGQVVETRAGPKFVPGQTVDTPEGPKFVPGQIVDTKAGPTFIPGQVISTSEEGSRFVPGQVVETVHGPRFVPGRVVEAGERVAFVPGQVVQTEDGLRFVAPDLTDGCEFSVQGFEVTPEELRLLRPAGAALEADAAATAAALDGDVLRQLSAAGVAVGRHVPADLPGVAVASDAVLASPTVRELSSRLALRAEESVQLGGVLGTVVRLGTELLEQARSPADLQRLKVAAVDSTQAAGDEGARAFVRSLVAAVALTASQHPPEQMLRCAGEVLGELLQGVEPPAAATLVQSLHAFLSTPGAVRELRNDARAVLRAECKLQLLRALVAEAEGERGERGERGEAEGGGPPAPDEDGCGAGAVERLAAVLGDQGREEVLGEAFARISEGRPELVGRVLGHVSARAAGVATERDASEAVQRAIVCAVRESSERQLKALLEPERPVSAEEEEDLRELLGEAVGLARALGLFDAADSLLEVLDDPAATRALAADAVAVDVLRRLTVMRSLAARRPAHRAALRRLHEDPFEARDDPHLRELVRDSAVLLVEPGDTGAAPPLTSAADIPAALLLADNRLAVEDFLARAGHRAGPLLILKPGLQTVVPREASRAVLTGQCAYTVLDNNGIRYFEPLHVLSALRLPRVATHRFSMYRCAVAADGGSLSSSSDDLATSSTGRPSDSLLGGSFASTSAPSTRRRSSGAVGGVARRASLDTGTGTGPTATASPGSEHGSTSESPPAPPVPRGYLDPETRIRIASALAYGAPLPPSSLARRRSSALQPLPRSPPPSPPLSPPPSRSPSPYAPLPVPRPSLADTAPYTPRPSLAETVSYTPRQPEPAPYVPRQPLPARSPSPSDSPPPKDYRKLIDYKESSPLRRLSTKYASFLGNGVAGSREASPARGEPAPPRATSPPPAPSAHPRAWAREASPTAGFLAPRTTARAVRESTYDDELTPNQRRILQELRSNHLATLRARQMYGSPGRDDSPAPAPAALPRVLRNLSPAFDATRDASPPVHYSARDLSPAPNHYDYAPARRSRLDAARDATPPFRYVPRELSPVAAPRRARFDTNHDASPHRYVPRDLSPVSTPRRARFDTNHDASPHRYVTRDMSPLSAPRRARFDVSPPRRYVPPRDVSPVASPRRARFDVGRDVSPVRFAARDVSPVKPLSAYLPAPFRSRERAARGAKEASPSGVSLRTARLLKELSPAARGAGSGRSPSPSPGRRATDGWDGPAQRRLSAHEASPSRRAYGLRRHLTAPRGDALRLDSASPTEPLSLGSFRTPSAASEADSLGRAATPDDVDPSPGAPEPPAFCPPPVLAAART
ncbi:hypothetical protein R5R35_008158 [Gryllus longicercus]|uniref:Uncharacterized protein n=1 Tax=Gryllus longicercus TaxID=2509291 RepID=A0AAN9ZBT4_9ORTH